jgi:hypothetical protein
MIQAGPATKTEIVEGNDTLTTRELRTWNDTILKFLGWSLVCTEITIGGRGVRLVGDRAA